MKSIQTTHVPHGFGFAQSMVSLAVTSVLAVGAYKVMNGVTRVTQTSMSTTSKSAASRKVADQIVEELSNVVSIEDIGESVLKNKEPLLCKPTLAVSPVSMSSSIIPFPGKSYADIHARTNLDAIEPSDDSEISGPTGKKYDAVRYVYRTSVGKSYPLALNSTDGNKPYITTGTNPIVLDYISVGVAPDFKVGDYFLISDIDGMGLGRVTSSASCNSGKLCFYKSTGSIWNVASMRNYGRDSTGGALSGGANVEKVSIATIAYDPVTKSLMRDDHIYDDGFNPITMSEISSASLAKKWRSIYDNATNFKVEYLVEKTGQPTLSEFVRNPRIGEWGETNKTTAPYCGNQLGQPYMHQISVTLDTDQGTNSKMVAIGSLKANSGGGGAGGGGSASYETSAIYIPKASTIGAPGAGSPGTCLPPCLGGGIY